VQPRSLDGAQIVLLLSLDSRPVCSPRRLRHSRNVHAALPSSKLEVMEGQIAHRDDHGTVPVRAPDHKLSRVLVTGRRQMVKLYNAATNQPLGDITDDQRQFLIDQFEEEWEGDQDYYINIATVDMLNEAGADPALLALLQRALGAAGEADIRWSSR
jgi:hypothetical protein